MTTPVPTEDETLLADYEALRHGIGAFRHPRDVVRVWGPEAAGYLQGQCSQDLAPLALGGSADSLLLAPDGKVVALVRVSRTGDEEFLVDCQGGHGRSVEARLARFKLRSKFEMALVTWQCLSLRGTAVDGDVARCLGASSGVVLAVASAFNGWQGVDLLGPEPNVELPGLRWCGEDAWEACRIEAGLPTMDRELGDGRTIAAEAGLVESTVSFTKGCYTGQELVARLDARGSRVARRLCGVVVSDSGHPPSPGERGALVSGLAGARLVVPRPAPGEAGEGGDKEVGTLTSVAWSPALDAVVALAFVHRSVELDSTVDVCPVSASSTGPASSTPRPAAVVRALPLV